MKAKDLNSKDVKCKSLWKQGRVYKKVTKSDTGGTGYGKHFVVTHPKYFDISVTQTFSLWF